MIIRILWVVAALTVAFVLSYKLDLSKWWTLFFTMIVGSAVSYIHPIQLVRSCNRYQVISD